MASAWSVSGVTVNDRLYVSGWSSGSLGGAGGSGTLGPVAITRVSRRPSKPFICSIIRVRCWFTSQWIVSSSSAEPALKPVRSSSPSSIVLDRVDVEHPIGNRLLHVLAEDQVPDVAVRDADALVSGQAHFPADVEEAFGLLVDAADGLDLSPLVDGAGDGDVLADGDLGEGGDQDVELGRTGAVALDAAVRLLEADAGGERQRPVATVDVAQVAADDEHGLVVRPARELGLSFDVDQALRPQSHGGGHARGPAEGVIAQVDDGQAVDLPDLAALHIDEQRAFLDQLANLLGDAVGPVDAILQGLLDVQASTSSEFWLRAK